MSLEERSATPTVDERANAVVPSNSLPPTTMRPAPLLGNMPPATTLPDTSIPPPVINPAQTYPILPIAPNMHPYGKLLKICIPVNFTVYLIIFQSNLQTVIGYKHLVLVKLGSFFADNIVRIVDTKDDEAADRCVECERS